VSERESGSASGRLTGKQRAFIDEWFANGFNGRRAAQAAGYAGDDRTLRNAASRLLTNANVRAEIERRWRLRNGVTPEEVESVLAAQMRGNIADLLRDDVLMLDPDAVREHGHLVESIRWTKTGVHVKLYSAQKAAELIGKTMGMFRDVVEQTGGVTVVIDR